MSGGEIQNARVVAIIPAAGLSSRYPGNLKLLEPFGKQTVIEHVVRRIQRLGLSDILVVTGHGKELVEKALTSTDVRTVFNPRFEMGMGTSIATGVLQAPDADYFLIWPGDMPGIAAETVRVLLGCRKPGSIIVPVDGGRRGHPVLFSATYRTDLVNLASDEGARSILAAHASHVVEVLVPDPAIFADIDDREDLTDARLLAGLKNH